MSMGSVASQMESMRIIAASLVGKQNTALHFLPANSQRQCLLNEWGQEMKWVQHLTARIKCCTQFSLTVKCEPISELGK